MAPSKQIDTNAILEAIQVINYHRAAIILIPSWKWAAEAVEETEEEEEEEGIMGGKRGRKRIDHSLSIKNPLQHTDTQTRACI